MKERLNDFGLLILRLGFGLGMAYHGYGKVFVYHDVFVSGLTSMGFPAPALFAWLATLSEFIGGICLVLGLCTRTAAYFIACTMAVAAFTALAGKTFEEKELALAFLFASLALAFTGCGRFALDRLCCRCDAKP